jgi:hypothetical protein
MHKNSPSSCSPRGGENEKAKRFLWSPSAGNELEVVSYYDAGLMEQDEPEIFLMRLEGVLAAASSASPRFIGEA